MAGLAERMEALAKAGIGLSPGIGLAEIAEALEGGASDSLALLGVLGGDQFPEWRPRSAGVWLVDAECICGDGSYVAIAERMRLLGGDALPIEGLRDHVGEDEAWLAFTLRGTEHRWVFRIDDDWVDPSVFSRFAQLLDAQGVGRHYTYLSLGQYFLVGCATEEQRLRLNELPGVHFEWMK